MVRSPAVARFEEEEGPIGIVGEVEARFWANVIVSPSDPAAAREKVGEIAIGTVIVHAMLILIEETDSRDVTEASIETTKVANRSRGDGIDQSAATAWATQDQQHLQR